MFHPDADTSLRLYQDRSRELRAEAAADALARRVRRDRPVRDSSWWSGSRWLGRSGRRRIGVTPVSDAGVSCSTP